jgi:hypothetical protein
MALLRKIQSDCAFTDSHRKQTALIKRYHNGNTLISRRPVARNSHAAAGPIPSHPCRSQAAAAKRQDSAVGRPTLSAVLGLGPRESGARTLFSLDLGL